MYHRLLGSQECFNWPWQTIMNYILLKMMCKFSYFLKKKRRIKKIDFWKAKISEKERELLAIYCKARGNLYLNSQKGCIFLFWCEQCDLCEWHQNTFRKNKSFTKDLFLLASFFQPKFLLLFWYLIYMQHKWEKWMSPALIHFSEV